jgi:hypothetical protein
VDDRDIVVNLKGDRVEALSVKSGDPKATKILASISVPPGLRLVPGYWWQSRK